MRLSDFFIPAVKETPADAELVSHQLMLRSGMMSKLASGLYSWMPLGLRVLRKVEAVVREEMQRAGVIELLMPVVQPGDLWQESERWDKYGNELLSFSDRHERPFCLGPTHEEVIVDMMRGPLRSYKQLPLNFFQIQTKFRDEIRPRFGVMRAREFMMKDAYSFHMDPACLQKTYDRMYEAYEVIFDRLGLNYRAVLADNGSIGGTSSHEFQVLAESGEDLIVYSDSSSYAANIERAQALAPIDKRPSPSIEMSRFDTPGLVTIEALCAAHDVSPQQSVKTLIVKGSEQPLVALIIRGDHTLNEIKAAHLPQVASPLVHATEEEVQAQIGADFGSLGPVGLSLPCIVDRDASVLADFVCGANETGVHCRGVNWERDVPLPDVADIRNVVAGDASPDGEGTLHFARGIEVGQVFQLGDTYSNAMNLHVLDASGKSVTPYMGCYGIGLTRTIAAAIEQHHDDAGIIWPDAMAPFDIALVPVQMHKSYRVRDAAEKLYQQLVEAGYSVLFDDRKERPGAMFAMMDLIGIPHRLVVGERGIDDEIIEYKSRRASEAELWPQDEVMQRLQHLLK